MKKIKNKEGIKYLKIDWYSKEKLPKELCEFTNLNTLIIWNSSVKEIPIRITVLRNLSHLEVVACLIDSITTKISHLSLLEKVVISNNPKLKEIPETIWNLKNLKVLDLSYNINLELKYLNHLPSVERLNLNGISSLTDLPQGIENYYNLESLSIGSLNIDYNKELLRLKELYSLSYLNIAYSKLNSFPESLFELFQLEEIIARGNNFSSFPDSFRKISGLKLLDLALNETKIKHSERNKLKSMIPICEINW
ncbi:MAG: hypothetical protein RIE58_02315 [Vicingaceae bacterium]